MPFAVELGVALEMLVLVLDPLSAALPPPLVGLA